MFFPVFNFPVLCRPLILVYQRVNINGYLHVQGLNCSNARGDGTITSLETSPEIDQRRCNLKWHIVEQKSQHDQWSSTAISDCSPPHQRSTNSIVPSPGGSQFQNSPVRLPKVGFR